MRQNLWRNGAPMNFRLVDSGWEKLLDDSPREHPAGLQIVCPFIKSRTVAHLLKYRQSGPIQVLTRFCLDDFANGVSDTSALQLLMRSGAQIRGIRNLHAKLYLFGGRRAVVSSANLTESALTRNHEFGFVAEDPTIVAGCNSYFDDKWARSGPDLSADQLANWETRVSARLTSGAPPNGTDSMGDEGVDVGLAPAAHSEIGWIVNSEQAFVKFFGASDNRADPAMLVLNEVV
jgi:hypothetical protein